MSVRAICRSLLILSAVTTLVTGCAAIDPYNYVADPTQLPPILTQDEVIRNYTSLGRIIITREVFMSDGMAESDIREWGFSAVRREALKMGADAVIFPEVRGTATMTLIPGTEYRASGVAIKFK